VHAEEEEKGQILEEVEMKEEEVERKEEEEVMEIEKTEEQLQERLEGGEKDPKLRKS